MDERIAALLAQQDDVVARFQMSAAGLTDGDVARLMRRRYLIRVHRRSAFDSTAMMNLAPPRVRYEHAAIDAAADARQERHA